MEKATERKDARRENVIRALVHLHFYEAADQRLFELPVARLERQLKRFLATSHPHSGLGSLRI